MNRNTASFQSISTLLRTWLTQCPVLPPSNPTPPQTRNQRGRTLPEAGSPPGKAACRAQQASGDWGHHSAVLSDGEDHEQKSPVLTSEMGRR